MKVSLRRLFGASAGVKRGVLARQDSDVVLLCSVLGYISLAFAFL
jgi:hypothetical protein